MIRLQYLVFTEHLHAQGLMEAAQAQELHLMAINSHMTSSKAVLQREFSENSE